jgi:hypothetical protein
VGVGVTFGCGRDVRVGVSVVVSLGAHKYLSAPC